jgi:hypothetical protein
MIIDHKLNLIFIAVPKTGSTSIHFFLKNVLSVNTIYITTNKNFFKKNIALTKHSSSLDIKNMIHDYDSYHTFAVVRNPYDWCVSWYTSWGSGVDSWYLRVKEREAEVKGLLTDEMKRIAHPYGNMTFEEFLKDFKYIVEVEQLDRLTDENGKIIVDTIIRYENLETEFLSLLDKLNINYSTDPRVLDLGLSRENVSSERGNRDYREFYNADTKRLVEEYQMKTIKHFNYKF